MSEMVERVARAIALRRGEIMLGADPATQTADERQLARAAIEAMREPTDAMAIDGSNTKVRVWDTAKETFLDDPQPVWRAMIDAALGVQS